MNERERKEVDAVIEKCRSLLARLEKLPGDLVVVPEVGDQDQEDMEALGRFIDDARARVGTGVERDNRMEHHFRMTMYRLVKMQIDEIGADAAMDVAGEWGTLGVKKSAGQKIDPVQDHRDIVAAIGQGMSLGEYLEYDSARSWLDRQREGGAV